MILWKQKEKKNFQNHCTRGSQLFQYFVGYSSGFEYDMSSYVTKHLQTVRATFHSSLFEHCASVPIWASSDGSQLIFLPSDNSNCNFAWGSNGKKNQVRRKIVVNCVYNLYCTVIYSDKQQKVDED